MHVSVVMKATRGCNLRCTYCNEWQDTTRKMPEEVIGATAELFATQEDVTTTRWIWHGGEPLLCGRSYFQRAHELQENLRRAGCSVWNAIQTNGLLLDEEWIAFLTDHRFSIGLSLDGPPALQNAQRPGLRNRPSAPAARRAVERLGLANVPFGVLSVVTRLTYEMGANTLFDYLVEAGITEFGILRHRPAQLPDATYSPGSGDHLSFDEFEDFERDLFDVWLAHDDPRIKIRDFVSIVRALAGGQPTVCTLAGACIGRNFAVNPNGDIYHCDHFVGDPAYRLGNVLVDAPATIFDGKKMLALLAREAQRLAGLRSCPYVAVCRGGCPSDHYIQQRTLDFRSSGCCGRGGIVDHIARRMESVTSGTFRNAAWSAFDAVGTPAMARRLLPVRAR